MKHSIIALLFCLTTLGARAESAFEYIFQTGKIDDAVVGVEYHYVQSRTDVAQELDQEMRELHVVVGDENLELTLYDEDKHRRMGTYPKAVGNPVHMYFLETIINDMQIDTGGSNFYIRNRLKDALARTEATPVACVDGLKCIELSPFEEDQARDRMGVFADIKLSFVIDETHPLWVVEMKAENPQEPESYAFVLDLE